jgi:hypothetical protein
MWRVRLPDGRLSDLLNLSRAKQLARRLEATLPTDGKRKAQADAPDVELAPRPAFDQAAE